MLAPDDEQVSAELEALWPLKRFPMPVDEGRTLIDASIIIKHLGLHHPRPIGLISKDRTRLGPSLLGIVAAFASFFLLALALPIGLAYAVWTGIGCVGIALVGIIVFGESTARLRSSASCRRYDRPQTHRWLTRIACLGPRNHILFSGAGADF